MRPFKELWQGCPLSPYFFLFCVEGLSVIIRQREQEHTLMGISVAGQAPKVCHLLFADDSILFGRASMREGEEIRTILELYAKASG